MLAVCARRLSLRVGTGTSNNYAYLIRDDKTKDAVIIDLVNPSEYARLLYNPRLTANVLLESYPY